MHADDGRVRLDPKRVKPAVRALSKRGRFRFTMRNLYYKLVRVGAWPQPNLDPIAALGRFREALQQYESRHGPIPGRIRHADRLPEIDLAQLPPDIADYTTRRVIVFDRQESFLVFALNGFFRKIEIGLLVWPDYPKLVWERMHQHLAGGAATTIYLLHDCNRFGYDMKHKMQEALRDYGAMARVVDLGLRFRQASNLGVAIRNDASRADPSELDPLKFGVSGDRQEARLLLRSGSFAHLEELPPLRMMRWTYSRIATRVHDVGYG